MDLLILPVQAYVARPFPGLTRAPAWPARRFALASEVPTVEPPRHPAPVDSLTGRPVSVEDIQAARDAYLERTPANYTLAFEPGLSVEVVGKGHPPTFGDRWGEADRLLRRGWAAMGQILAGRPRPLHLRLAMDRRDARRLCLALDPEIPLLVAAGAP